MRLFSNKQHEKPTIRVISVKHEKRDVEDSTTNMYGYGHSTTNKSVVKRCSYTIVLMSKDGYLMTREFNGTWDLTDIKKWEDL